MKELLLIMCLFFGIGCSKIDKSNLMTHFKLDSLVKYRHEYKKVYTYNSDTILTFRDSLNILAIHFGYGELLYDEGKANKYLVSSNFLKDKRYEVLIISDTLKFYSLDRLYKTIVTEPSDSLKKTSDDIRNWIKTVSRERVIYNVDDLLPDYRFFVEKNSKSELILRSLYEISDDFEVMNHIKQDYITRVYFTRYYPRTPKPK